MGKPMIVIGSITYAMKGQELLTRNGIRSSVERIYRNMGGRGCGYGLLVQNRADDAEKILKQADIPVSDRVEWEAQ